MKKFIQVHGLPTIRFAHKFVHKVTADKYLYTILALPQGQTVMEVTYIVKGVLNCTLPGGETIAILPNSVLCNFRTENIKVCIDGYHEHHTVCFTMPATVTDASDEDGLLLPFVTSLPEGDNKILRFIDEIIHVNTVHTKGKLANAGGFLQMLDAIDRYNRTRADALTYANYKYVKKAKEYIYTHLSEPIRQTDIAAHLHISPEYLCKVFKNGEGIPVMQFVNRVKLEQMRNLLENKSLTLSQAAALYGYADPNYVSRLYKKYFQRNIMDF